MEKKEDDKRKRTTVDVVVIFLNGKEVRIWGRMELGNMNREETPESRVASLKELQRRGSCQTRAVHVRGRQPLKVSLQDVLLDPNGEFAEDERPSIPYGIIVTGIKPEHEEDLRNAAQKLKEGCLHLEGLLRLPPEEVLRFTPGPLEL